MIGVSIAIICLLSSIAIMVGAIVLNRIDPNYGSALAVPIFNMLSMFVALIGLVISSTVRRQNQEMALAKYTMICGIALLVILALLFPFSNSGALSVVG